jgi:hypothetical protein
MVPCEKMPWEAERSGSAWARGLTGISGRERSVKLLKLIRSLTRGFAREMKSQSMRGVPRRSARPVTPKIAISANAMMK